MDIDIVIPWVDGADPVHEARRLAFSDVDTSNASDEFHKQERSEAQRWLQHNEIIFSLRTIDMFAPWVNRIFIVTDQQEPDLSTLGDQFRKKIQIVDHTEIFSGHECALPNFNSASIGTASCQIKSLAKHYIVFNDDCFFTQTITPEDFFDGDRTVLRGGYLRLRNDLNSNVAWNHHQMNSAILAGTVGRRYFHLAHICQPIRRDILTDFFDTYPNAFSENIHYRFRDKSQFNVSSLSAQLCIARGQAELRYNGDDQDWHVLPTSIARNRRPMVVSRELKRFLGANCKIGCVNDIEVCMKKVPETWKILESLF